MCAGMSAEDIAADGERLHMLTNFYRAHVQTRAVKSTAVAADSGPDGNSDGDATAPESDDDASTIDSLDSDDRQYDTDAWWSE